MLAISEIIWQTFSNHTTATLLLLSPFRGLIDILVTKKK